MDADLTPEKTEGFKVGEKKTIDEYTKLGRHLMFLTSIIVQRYPFLVTITRS
jgi:hypothetical protein